MPFPPGRNLSGEIPGNKLPGYDHLVPPGRKAFGSLSLPFLHFARGIRAKIGADYSPIETMEQEHNPAPNGNEEATAPIGQVAKKKILLVDDHPIFRNGLTEPLDRQVELVACGHADSA